MAGDGTSFQIDLGVTGGGAYDSAATSAVALADAIEKAGAASAAADTALKAGASSYAAAESAADRAAKAVERIGLAVEAQKGKAAKVAEEFGLFSPQFQKASDKLGALTARQSEAVSKAAAASAAMNSEAAALDKLKAAAGQAADNEAKLNKAQKQATDAAKAAAKSTASAGDSAGESAINFRALSSGLGKLGGPLGSVGSQAAGVGGALQKLSKSLGAAGPYVAAAVLAVALAAAFVVATLSITKFAISAADTARTGALLSDGIAGSVAGGRQLDATFASLANKVPLTREELTGMASDLAKTGLKGDALSAALETAAVKAATLKFGPNFGKQLLSLDNQSARLKANVTGLFSGLKIESLLEGLAKLVALFDASGASGKAIKVVFESIFQPIVDGLVALIPKAVATFLQLEILALKAAIAIKPYSGILVDIGYGFAILAAVVVGIVAIFVGAGLLMVAAFAGLLALPFLIKDGFAWLGGAISSTVGGAVDWVTNKFNEVLAFLQGLSFAEIGTQLIQGLINGITGGGAGVITAITGIASDAIGAAKKSLGIASPSKVFAEIGMHTAAGMSEGVEGGAAGVQSSLETMVSPPDAPAAGGSTTNSTTSNGGTVYQITIQGGGDAQSNVAAFTTWLEGLGAQAGTAVPNA